MAVQNWADLNPRQVSRLCLLHHIQDVQKINKTEQGQARGRYCLFVVVYLPSAPHPISRYLQPGSVGAGYGTRRVTTIVMRDNQNGGWGWEVKSRLPNRIVRRPRTLLKSSLNQGKTGLVRFWDCPTHVEGITIQVKLIETVRQTCQADRGNEGVPCSTRVDRQLPGRRAHRCLTWPYLYVWSEHHRDIERYFLVLFILTLFTRCLLYDRGLHLPTNFMYLFWWGDFYSLWCQG